MTREAWTRLIGALDILRYLRSRAHWGALVWTIVLGVAISPELGGAVLPSGGHLMAAVVGGVWAGVAMTWRLHERQQWTGVIPYLIATAGVLLLLVPLTLIAHWIWHFESPLGLRWFLAMGALGVLCRGIGTTVWLAPYGR